MAASLRMPPDYRRRWGAVNASRIERVVVGGAELVILDSVIVEAVLHLILVDILVVLVGIVVLLADLPIFHVEIVVFGIVAEIGLEVGDQGAVGRAVARGFEDFGALAFVIALLVIAVVARSQSRHLISAHAPSPEMIDRRTAQRARGFPSARRKVRVGRDSRPRSTIAASVSSTSPAARNPR